MKCLVVYYSLDGSCEFVAKEVAKKMHADTLKLELVKDLSKNGFLKMFHGGKQAVFKELPPLKDYAIDLDAYDCVVIGTPVWAGNVTPALRTFASQTKITNKNVILYCSCAGGPGKTLEAMESLFSNNNILQKEVFHQPIKKPQEAMKQIDEMIKI